MIKPWHSWLIRAVIALGGVHLPLLLLLVWSSPKDRAVAGMGTGLYLIWCVGATALMWRNRERARELFLRLPGTPWVKFFLFCLGLLMLEEVVTTTMTRCAPLFGVPVGVAYITGSANYVEVVLWHSVIALFPTYIAWALVLRRVAIHPNTAYLFYGFTGVLSEVLYGGPHQFLATAFWVSVYGPMIYLPAFCVYGLGERARPRAWHFGLILVLGALFTMPSAWFVQTFRPADAGFPEVLRRGP